MPVTKKKKKKKKKRKKKNRPKCWWQLKNGCPNQASKQLTPNERRLNNKSWWQTKKGCPNQASKQLTPNERNKTAETTSKTQTVAYLQTQGGKNITKSQQSNRLLSATNEWTTTYTAHICCSHKRTEINVPTNRWKAKLTITNINLKKN